MHQIIDEHTSNYVAAKLNANFIELEKEIQKADTAWLADHPEVDPTDPGIFTDTFMAGFDRKLRRLALEVVGDHKEAITIVKNLNLTSDEPLRKAKEYGLTGKELVNALDLYGGNMWSLVQGLRSGDILKLLPQSE